MTQGEIEQIAHSLERIFSDLELRIMQDIVRRIKINGFSTASADWQITRLQQLGKTEKEIREWVKAALEISDEETEKIFSDKTYEEYMKHERAYELFGKEQIPFEKNENLQRMVEAVKRQIGMEFQNMANSMGFAIKGPDGKIIYTPLLDYYRKTLDNAVMDIKSGAFSYQRVLERTIRDMTRSGLRWIDYDSGWHNRVDVAARRAVLTGFRQVQGKINQQVAAELNTDSYEVTYHVGARPSHQLWQGKVFTMQELEAICGLGTVTGLHGANCYHDYRPFIPGISVRTYTDEQLEQMNREENKPKDYYGRQYTTYEALQQQRKMETAMRATRQEIQLLRDGEADPTSITLKKAKYYGQMQKYEDFSEKMKLPMQKTRIYQDGLKGNFSDKRAYEKIKEERIKRISDTDKKAIFDYMSAKSYIINDKLRNNRELTNEDKEFVENLDKALVKMPVYKGNLQRSLYFNSTADITEFMEEYKVGGKKSYDEYLSTTKGSIYNPEGQVQIYIQNSKKGRDISSLNEDEKEVLYQRGSVFEVINIVEENGAHYILLEESDE